MTGGNAGDTAVWADAGQRLRAELRRIDDVADELHDGTRNLRWQGPGAGRFRRRTARRLDELADQRWLLRTALNLIERAAEEQQAARRHQRDRPVTKQHDRHGVSGGGEG